MEVLKRAGYIVWCIIAAIIFFSAVLLILGLGSGQVGHLFGL